MKPKVHIETRKIPGEDLAVLFCAEIYGDDARIYGRAVAVKKRIAVIGARAMAEALGLEVRG